MSLGDVLSFLVYLRSCFVDDILSTSLLMRVGFSGRWRVKYDLLIEERVHRASSSSTKNWISYLSLRVCRERLLDISAEPTGVLYFFFAAAASITGGNWTGGFAEEFKMSNATFWAIVSENVMSFFHNRWLVVVTVLRFVSGLNANQIETSVLFRVHVMLFEDECRDFLDCSSSSFHFPLFLASFGNLRCCFQRGTFFHKRLLSIFIFCLSFFFHFFLCSIRIPGRNINFTLLLAVTSWDCFREGYREVSRRQLIIVFLLAENSYRFFEDGVETDRVAWRAS